MKAWLREFAFHFITAFALLMYLHYAPQALQWVCEHYVFR